MTDLARSRLQAALFGNADAKQMTIEAGEILIHEGHDADSVYVLLDGSLQVSRQLENDPTVLAIIDQPGTVVGELVALGGGKRTATVTAVRRSSVLCMSASSFQLQLKGNPEIASELVAIAVRRAEELELTELLADHFDITDQETLVTTCSRVQWERLAQGETLFEESDPSDSVYFVVRGRLLATRADAVDGVDVKIGEMGRGDVVGEIGLMAGAPRSATVKAIRDSVVARMDERSFMSLVESQPGMMVELCLRAVARAENTRWHSAPSTVLAVVGHPRALDERLTDQLERELSRFGKVNRLSPQRIDTVLDAPGIHDVERGDVGDVRVSRVVHEQELEAEHLIVEVGHVAGSWSQRALGMADRVLILVPPDLNEPESEQVDNLLGGCPEAVHRTVVIVRSGAEDRPRGSAPLGSRFGARDVINIKRGSDEDVSRLARVSVGRANALVLSGGGGRGFAHIGVYRALTELGVPIDLVGGTSIGAIIGAAIADEMTPEGIVEWAYDHFPRSLDYTIPIVSLTKGDRIAQSAVATFGDRQIEDLWRTYFAVSTDLTSSRLQLLESGSIALAVRATSAIPGVMPPVPQGESLLIDGGVLNNLPIDIARAKTPAGNVIAVDVAPPRGPGAHSDYGLSVSGWEALRSSLGAGRSRYPKISAVLMRSMITASMLERDSQISAGLADCYLDLDMRGVSMLEFDDPAGVAQRGYESALPVLEDWMHSTST